MVCCISCGAWLNLMNLLLPTPTTGARQRADNVSIIALLSPIGSRFSHRFQRHAFCGRSLLRASTSRLEHRHYHHDLLKSSSFSYPSSSFARSKSDLPDGARRRSIVHDAPRAGHRRICILASTVPGWARRTEDDFHGVG